MSVAQLAVWTLLAGVPGQNPALPPKPETPPCWFPRQYWAGPLSLEEFYRRWGNQAFILMVNLLFGGKYSDLCYGYSAFWRDLVPGLALECDGFEVETVLNIRALRANWRVWEVPSFEAPRLHGTGRLRTIPDGWRVLTSIFREARDHYLRSSKSLFPEGYVEPELGQRSTQTYVDVMSRTRPVDGQPHDFWRIDEGRLRAALVGRRSWLRRR